MYYCGGMGHVITENIWLWKTYDVIEFALSGNPSASHSICSVSCLIGRNFTPTGWDILYLLFWHLDWILSFKNMSATDTTDFASAILLVMSFYSVHSISADLDKFLVIFYFFRKTLIEHNLCFTNLKHITQLFAHDTYHLIENAQYMLYIPTQAPMACGTGAFWYIPVPQFVQSSYWIYLFVNCRGVEHIMTAITD